MFSHHVSTESEGCSEKIPTELRLWTVEQGWCGNLMTYILVLMVPSKPSSSHSTIHCFSLRHMAPASTSGESECESCCWESSSMHFSRMEMVWVTHQTTSRSFSKRSPVPALLLTGQQREEVSKGTLRWWIGNQKFISSYIIYEF